MKKLLCVTYFWPPSGKASVHWPLKMVKYLPQFDWMPAVLAAEDTFAHPDKSLLDGISPDVRVVKTSSLEPFSIYRRFMGKDPSAPLLASEAISRENRGMRQRISIWLRMNLFVPDARVGWYWPALRSAMRSFEKGSLDAVVSVGPPHTGHLIARTIARRHKIPHIPVFIDPWVDIVYYKGFSRNKMALRIDNALERSVVRDAREVVFVTRSMKDDYEQKYPFLREKANVLYWGYDEEDFASTSLPPAEPGIIVHAGNMFGYQNPVTLWEEIRRRIDRGEKLRLRFIGTVANEVVQSITRAGLSEHTEYLGFLSYSEMLRQLSRASYVVACVTEERHVPGKLFEYLRIGRPIIAFGEGNEEVKQMLQEANAGMLFRYRDPVAEFFDRAGKFSRDLSVVRRYDRRGIAQSLASILTRVSR